MSALVSPTLLCIVCFTSLRVALSHVRHLSTIFRELFASIDADDFSGSPQSELHHTEGAHMASQSRVRRRAHACARCRIRKVHCDGLSSACSLCIEAGVTCVAMDSHTNKHLPRSIAQFLETKIAERERERSRKHFPTKVCHCRRYIVDGNSRVSR